MRSALDFKYFLGKKKFSVGVFRFDYAKSLLKRSWKIMLAGLLIMCQARVEYFLVEKFLGWQDLGQYSAALKIFEIIDVACIVLVTVLMPKLALVVNEQNVQIYRRRAYLAGLLVYLMLVPAMIILIILFPYAYGDQYAQAAMILPWLFLRPFFGMLNSIRTMFIVLDSNYWSSALSALLGLGASLIVGYQLIPSYGLQGAVATTLIGLFCLTVVADILFNRKNFIAVLSCFYEFQYFMHMAKKR
jgi:O-antigen/teichoic acid export membrane protein